jgi:hypothetical protein
MEPNHTVDQATGAREPDLRNLSGRLYLARVVALADLIGGKIEW